MIQPQFDFSSIWSDEERRAWALPAETAISDWTDENIILPRRFAAEPGPFRMDRTPYMREPTDCFADPLIESITLMFGTQLGKTQLEHNLLAWIIDQNPGPTLYVMGREDDARRISYNRVLPLLRESKALTRHMPRMSDDIKKLEYIFPHMNMRFSGAASPASLASDPIKFVFFDEVDKYPLFSGREADPLSLATERQGTFWDKKTVYVSTPTTRDGRIHRLYEQTDRREYWVPCPHCKEYQVLDFYGGVKFGKEREPDKIENENLAWYECKYCRGRIEDHHKPDMLEAGVWCPAKCKVNKKGKIEGDIPALRHRGYRLSALYSPWKTFSQIAAKFIRSKDDPETLMNFVNSWLAEIWEETAVKTEEDNIRAKAILEPYPRGYVPRDGLVLTAGCDVQENRILGSIRAWGVNERSWLIRCFEIDDFEDLETILFRTSYKKIAGKETLVTLALIDSRYRQSEVYNFCRKWRNQARATMGYESLHGVRWRGKRIDRKPRTGEVIKGGLIRFDIDTNFFKDRLSRFISSDYGDENQWLVYEGIEDDYVKQMCAEHKVQERNRQNRTTKIVWKKKTWSRPNHFWDCEVLNCAAADMLKVQLLRPGQEIHPYRAEPKQIAVSDQDQDRVRGSKWIDQKWSLGNRGWLNR